MRPPLDPTSRRPLVVALAATAAGLALMPASAPTWWAGLVLLAAGLSLAWDTLGPLARARWEALSEPRRVLGAEVVPARALAEVACLAALLLTAYAMMPEVAAGDRPVTHDHPVHFAKAWMLRYELLPSGRLYGWSDQMFGGYPANYLYPPGTDLFVVAVHLLGLGALSLSAAYGVAFFAFFWLSGYAVYRVGQRFLGRAAGLVAALLYLTDTGAFRYGGWVYTVDFGVWPQSLSLAFALLALARLPAVLEGRSWRPVASFGVLAGISLVTHPMPLMLFPPLLLVAVVLRLARRPPEEPGAPPPAGPGLGLARLGAGTVVAALVACTWLLPFLDTATMAEKYGVHWKSNWQLAMGLLDLNLLEGTWGLVLVLGVLGLAPLLRDRRLGAAVIAWSVPLLFALGSSSVLDELHLMEAVRSFRHVQFSRLSILVKPFVFLSAGAFLVALVRWGATAAARAPAGSAPGAPSPWRRAFGDTSPWRRAFGAACLALLVGPILVSFAVDYYTRQVERDLPTAGARLGQEDRARVAARVAAEPALGPRDRVMLAARSHDHDLVDLAAAVGHPVYKAGFTPASNFVYKMQADAPGLLELLNVRWIIDRADRYGPDVELIARFGDYRLYRFKRFRPEPFDVLDGEADVRLTAFEPERIELDVAPGATGRLRLGVSWFPRWRATRDGVEVPISAEPHPADRDRTGFMTVPLAPGHYRFEFVRPLRDRAAPFVGLAGLLLAGLLAFADRRRGLAARLVRPVEALGTRLDPLLGDHPRVLGGLAVAFLAGVVGAGLALGAWRPVVHDEGSPGVDVARVRYDFLERLADATVTLDTARGEEECPWRLDRFVCKATDWWHVTSRPESLEGLSMRRCISAHPNPDGPLTVSFPAVPAGDGLLGYYGVAETGKRGANRVVELRVDVDGEPLTTFRSRRDRTTHWFYERLPDGLRGRAEPVTVSFRVSAPDTRHRHFCFYVQMVDERDAR